MKSLLFATIFVCLLSLSVALEGPYVGYWRPGDALTISFNEDGSCYANIPGHSAGYCTYETINGLIVGTIDREDGIRQGFVVKGNGGGLEGVYVQFNTGTFTRMFIRRVRRVAPNE